MEIRPIFSALMRNKPGMILIVLQVAITLAVVCNSLFIILERIERVGRPSGMNEVDTFSITSLGFTSNFDVRATIRDDLDLLSSIPGVVAASTINSLPMSGGGWSTGFDTQPLDKTGTRRAQSSALYFVDEGGLDAFGAKLIEELGEETLMWGSDYPHTDGVWPESSKYITEQFREVRPETVRKITCDNAAKFYGLA